MSDKKAQRRYSLFPKTLADCIEPLTRPVFREQGMAGSRILTQWNAIVGPELARHTLPEKLSFPPGKKNGGTLTISTENGFATELQHMQPVILERLAGYFGYQAIARIVISHSWPSAPEPAKPGQRRPSLPPECKAMADEVDDPDLKDALASLAQALSTPRT